MLKNKNYNTIFHIWLISIAFLVALIIIVGGLTRLTDSGLSITEWELFKGILPPINREDWIKYFEAYKLIPQYTLLNNNMNIEEFKFIFLWEYAHRLLARFIGLFFLIPFLFFIIINLLSKQLILKLTNIFILIVIQGSIGWYMVKSGLTENISVSHYRLSIHLFIAFTIFSSLIWILLNSLKVTKKKFFQFNYNYLTVKLLLLLLFLQIILGAFVSGLDAGKIYQTWPLMNGNYLPDDTELSSFFDFNKASTVQFFHRNIAYLIFVISVYLGFNVFKKKETHLYNNYLLFILFINVQIVLGIFVLISGANIYLASMHQISSIFLVLIALSLYHRTISI